MKFIFKKIIPLHKHFSFLIIVYAILLIIDGITFQIIVQERNPSILMPIIFGGIILLMGGMTLKKDLQLYGKHGATTLSVIAFATSVTNFSELLTDLSKGLSPNNLSNSIMAILSIIFLVLAVRQFAKDRDTSTSKNKS